MERSACFKPGNPISPLFTAIPKTRAMTVIAAASLKTKPFRGMSTFGKGGNRM
jgi:hypothetical protein